MMGDPPHPAFMGASSPGTNASKPGTHVLKCAGDALSGRALNVHVCMRARALTSKTGRQMHDQQTPH